MLDKALNQNSPKKAINILTKKKETMQENVKKDIRGMFDQYLKLMKLNKEELSEVQLTETQRAFNGALGMFLVLIKEQTAIYRGNPKKVNEIVNNIQKELWKYWRSQGSDNFFDPKHKV